MVELGMAPPIQQVTPPCSLKACPNPCSLANSPHLLRHTNRVFQRTQDQVVRHLLSKQLAAAKTTSNVFWDLHCSINTAPYTNPRFRRNLSSWELSCDSLINWFCTSWHSAWLVCTERDQKFSQLGVILSSQHIITSNWEILIYIYIINIHNLIAVSPGSHLHSLLEHWLEVLSHRQQLVCARHDLTAAKMPKMPKRAPFLSPLSPKDWKHFKVTRNLKTS